MPPSGDMTEGYYIPLKTRVGLDFWKKSPKRQLRWRMSPSGDMTEGRALPAVRIPKRRGQGPSSPSDA